MKFGNATLHQPRQQFFLAMEEGNRGPSLSDRDIGPQGDNFSR